MSKAPATERCLNCGVPLSGPFCSSCGQRAVPANPTVRELTGDAWEELSGYDGRILATARGLLKPGQLTQDYLAGRRAHYLPPLRVYLTVSVLYFVIAAAAPATIDGASNRRITPGVSIQVTSPAPAAELSAEDRERLRASLAEAPWWVQPMLQSMLDSPEAFRARVFATMPRVLFAMLPVFAALVSLLYRGRNYPTALVFAAHLHSFAFIVMAAAELAKFTNSAAVAIGVGALGMAGLLVYTVMAFRRVYGGGWLAVLGKTIALGVAYALVSVPAFVLMLIWVTS